MSQPTFREIDCWIFDLDNTLYPPSANLFAQIDQRMTAFIQRELGVSAHEASRLRHDYWQTYGTTLAGLRARHAIDAGHFLAEAHDIDYAGLEHDRALAQAIQNLPGRRVIHTNGPKCHAHAVLEALGYAALFDAVFALEDADLVSKPNEVAFSTVYRKAGIDPSRSAMIEDDARNLIVPSAMSVRAVWLDHHGADQPPDHVDDHITDLTGFLRTVI